jgi:hypothetical protein
MATGSWPTIIDVASRLDPEGKIPVIAEMLSQCNDYADDMPWVEGQRAHRARVRVPHLDPGRRLALLQHGRGYGKSTTAKARVGMGMLEDYSQVDRALAEHSGDREKFRQSKTSPSWKACRRPSRRRCGTATRR